MKTTRTVRNVALTLALSLGGAPILAMGGLPARAGSNFGNYPLRQIGVLPEPAPSARLNAGSIVAVDDAARRMYYVYPDTDSLTHVITYDLRPRIPKPIVDGKFIPLANMLAASPMAVALDTKRHTLIFITGNVNAGSTTITLGNPSLTLYSDATHSIAATWNLAQKLPGFYPFGISYSAIDDRLYLVGEFSVSKYGAASTATFGSKAVGAVTAVVALDPASGDVRWMRPVPECQQALFTLGVGGLVARNSSTKSVSFACVSGGTATGNTYPGQAGLVRLHIDPKAADPAAAAQWPVDFFPISGNYFNGAASGIAAYDPKTDRFYLQSLAPKTPGAWVFDGRLSAWVGFVSATLFSDRWIGLNPALGHLYIGMWGGGSPPTGTDGVITSDVRQTPVPAGEFQPIVSSNFIATDPGSTRVFIRPWQALTADRAPYMVFEDVMPVTHGGVSVDYDANTTDTADTADASVLFNGGAAGYGAHTVQVGGSGGVFSGTNLEPPNVPPGTRAAMSGRAGSLVLSQSGAGAATQSLLVDGNTIQQYETQKPWPYEVTSCLDTEGKVEHEEFKGSTGTSTAEGAKSTVACDLAKFTVSGTSEMGASGSGTARVNHSSYSANAVRTTKDGVVVTTTATADGMSFAVDGGFKVTFGHVSALARSAAHGRPGTTSASWSREVTGVTVVGPDGKSVFTSPGCASAIVLAVGRHTVTDTCTDLGNKISKLLPTRLHVTFPMARVVASPKGAFAAIEQTDADYYQQTTLNDQGVIYRGDSVGPRPTPAMVVEAYNDSTEHSRTVNAFAATQATALFTIAPPYDYGSFDEGDSTVTSPGSPGTPDIPGTPGTAGNLGGNNPSTTTTQAGQPVQDLRGWLLMRRSLRDATLLVALSGLMLGGCATVLRRRRLVDVLVTVPRKEAV